MIQKILFSVVLITLMSCHSDVTKGKDIVKNNSFQKNKKPIHLSLKQANQLAKLPLKCIGQEYPNKPSQVLTDDADLNSPKNMHPVFYGCFDWHSAVHGHWSLVRLLKDFKSLKNADSIKKILVNRFSKENIQKEIDYFNQKQNYSYERTYGWAWLLKLSAELHTWDDSDARKMEENLRPLSNLIAKRFVAYLPKLKYPIRVGTHTNTAFALSFAYDYAAIYQDKSLLSIIEKRAKDYYFNDMNCPIQWEPSGNDFLSPCLEEVDIMRKVLDKASFMKWIHQFLPSLLNPDFDLAVGEVTDRTDGHLVHLDGLNFSRAWVLYGLVSQYDDFQHLNTLANKHIVYSLSNLVGDSYEGGHWLASFAINALTKS